MAKIESQWYSTNFDPFFYLVQFYHEAKWYVLHFVKYHDLKQSIEVLCRVSMALS